MPITLNGTTGEIFPTWTTGTRPSTPSQGQTGYNTTLSTLETYNGTSWIGIGAGGYAPAFRGYASASQTVTLSTATKVAIDNVSATNFFDTASCFSTVNNRFTPNVAGYYQVNGILKTNVATTYTQTEVYVYKNGAIYVTGGRIGASLTTSLSTFVTVSDIIYMNGTTDYIELWGLVAGSGTATFNTAASSTSTSIFSAALVRSA